MSIETVVVTGGNGTVGRAILEDLDEHGYRTVNVSRGERTEEVADVYRTADLLDVGEVYSSVAGTDADAIVHMGTIPGPTRHPDFVTYESNVQSAYNVLEVGHELGLESVVLPSSINVLGCAYQPEPVEVVYLPMDEDHPVTPRDPYAVSKHAMEVTADGFGRRANAPSISSLRYPWVASTEKLVRKFVEADRTLDAMADAWHHTTRDVLFSYIHAADAAEIARLTVEADHDGHERFWAVAADTSADVDSATLVEEFYPDVERREEIRGMETLISIEKAREHLGWEPRRSWRDL